MNIFMRIFLAINQGICLLVTGQNDMTISGWSYYKHFTEGKSGMCKFVDWLFFWEKGHCKNALKWEYRQAGKLQSKLHPIYIRIT